MARQAGGAQLGARRQQGSWQHMSAKAANEPGLRVLAHGKRDARVHGCTALQAYPHKDHQHREDAGAVQNAGGSEAVVDGDGLVFADALSMHLKASPNVWDGIDAHFF